MNKNLLTVWLIFCISLVLTACGSKSGNSAMTAEPGNHATESVTSSEASSEPAESTVPSKSLVVYFSWSGNTRRVAEAIQQQTGSDMFELIPVTPYSDDYNTVLDEAKTEQQNNARPEITGGIENIAEYDTIYVGFPNWWGDMPMILYSFFDSYDLSGKTVALFCTSGGSGLSNSANEVKALEPDAEMTPGLHIGSGASAAPVEAVAQWLEEIGTIKEEPVLNIPDEFILIPGGSFQMGSPEDEAWRSEDEIQHSVTVSDFYMKDMASYDTILLGYPNWWASIPMPVASFLEEYDFSGKTIIPFCSHGGGRFGQSLTAIAKLAPDASMGEALSIHYSGGSSLASDVRSWLEDNHIPTE